jgi:hypothetical protein
MDDGNALPSEQVCHLRSLASLASVYKTGFTRPIGECDAPCDLPHACKLPKSLYVRYSVAIFHTADITPQKSSFLFDVALREQFCFAHRSECSADFHPVRLHQACLAEQRTRM